MHHSSPLARLGQHVTRSVAVYHNRISAVLFRHQGHSFTQQGSLLAGLYLPVEPTTGHSKNRCATSIWATLWMSSSGTSLTANVEILGFMGNSIGLAYCGGWLLELVGFVPLPQRLLLTSTRVCHPLPTLTGEAGSQLASLLPG
ncbi:hypothetical protein J6590_052397 [Homalodisca vitripennis]|nr:hypothetical protein J6590_052397 [Homalodisca vitripennis]